MSKSQEYAVDESSDTKSLHAMDVYKDVLTEDLSWLRDNDYILRGYRTPLTFWESVVSMFHSHNETMNVWTHFLGSLLFIFLLYLTYALPVEKYSTLGNIQTQVVGLGTMVKEEVDTMWHGWKGTVPQWPITVFVLCAIRCLSGSAIFHNFLSTTRKTRAILQTLDYCGICILICGSYVPVVYYSFYHYPTYLKIHLTAVIAINVLNVSVMATPTFRQPKYRSVRAVSFTVVACYAVVIFAHLYMLEGFNNLIFTVIFWYLLGMGGTYILGAILYGTRFPEKYSPGSFDYVFSSHQLFHVCIVIAALFHYVGAVQAFIHLLNQS